MATVSDLETMQQQMLFARPSSEGSPATWAASENGSPRRVAFELQNAPRSPVVYRRRQQSQVGESPYAADPDEDSRVQQRRLQSRRQQKTQRRTVTARRTVAARAQPRKPGWDANMSHGSTLFDGSLKKSLLFQPRAGDRRKEEDTEKQGVPAVNSRRGTSATAVKRKNPATARPPVRYRSGPSSVYAQQRQNVTHWPQRRSKDFVRQNIEHLTGRPADARPGRSAARSGIRESVFERSSAPRSATPSPNVRRPADARPGRSAARSGIRESVFEHSSTPRSATPSPNVTRSAPGWSSPHSTPQGTQQSFSSPRSPAPLSNFTNRSSGEGSPRHDNYPARVFGVLDRSHEERIGVSQILQGLRLLGLPATHNQISDYVYLIHEGEHSTIDLEEWEILVGTLDAASRPSSHSPHKAYVSAIPSQSPLSRGISEPSPYSSSSPSNSPYRTGGHEGNLSPQRRDHVSRRPTAKNNHASCEEEEHYTTSVKREAIVSAEHQPIPDDDPYIVEIQNRIEGMFERAQATAALRWTPEVGNNQAENDPDHSRSDRILKRAATVVYSLRASLFPLVHQAEATLREIQQRHGSKLSLFLPPSDMAAIAHNSDMLASAILDDILLDTVQLLNDDDKKQSYRQVEVHQAGQLDDIMARIQEIEQEESNMIQQGLALSYEIQGDKCDLPAVAFQDSPKHDPHEVSHVPNLVLPLDVVMNINIPDSPMAYQEHQDAGEYVTSTVDGDQLNSDGLSIMSQQTLYAERSVRTHILQGKRLQSIERRKHKFQQHRRLVESSLAETGMAQFAVIEILEEMLLDDMVEQIATELNDTVLSLSDTLMTSLL